MSDDEDELAARIRALDGSGRRALLTDLEAIRSVLGERAAEPGDSIPVLREVVEPEERHRGAQAPRTSRTPEPPYPRDDTEAARRRAETQGDLFDPRAFADALLDADWRAEREAILADARRGADVLRGPATPTDAALRARLTQALGRRAEVIVDAALDDLRGALLAALREELTRALDAPAPDDSSQQSD